MHGHDAKHAGESDERLFAVAAWREAPYFTDAERAAWPDRGRHPPVSDREDAVPDHVWDAAARAHFDRPSSPLVMAIASINAWNRINGRHPPGRRRDAAPGRTQRDAWV